MTQIRRAHRAVRRSARQHVAVRDARQRRGDRVVTQSVALLARMVATHGGSVVKTLGDGLMAVFDHARARRSRRPTTCTNRSTASVAGDARGRRRAGRSRSSCRSRWRTARWSRCRGDCFGDAVNVAARLLDHAGDNETLATAPVLDGLRDERPRALPQPRPHAAARPRRAGACAPARGARGFGDTAATAYRRRRRRPVEPEASAWSGST